MKRIFISHYSGDRKIAEILSNIISRVTLGQINAWFSSDEDEGLQPGDMCFDKILKKLTESDALIAVITPNSVNKPWLYYESGMAQGLEGCEIIPVYVNFNIDDMKPPLSLYQSYQLSDYSSFREFVSKLIHKYGVKLDEEPFKLILEKAINEIVSFKSHAKNIDKATIRVDDIVADIKNYFDKRFLEFTQDHFDADKYNEKENNDRILYTVPIRIVLNPDSTNIQYIQIKESDTVQGILNKIYFLLGDNVQVYRYLQSWILVEHRTKRKLIMYEIADRIPAKYIFTRESKWQVERFDGPYDPQEFIHRTYGDF